MTTKDRLRHVRWIGGGSGAGKSTMARKLAAEHGLRIYRSDDTTADHADRLNRSDRPLLHQFLSMSLDEPRYDRTPGVTADTLHSFQREAFELLVEDLLALPDDAPILAEGFRLLPSLVAPLLSRRRQAVWLIPTPAFRRAAFEARGFTSELPQRTGDAERALVNLFARDRDEAFATGLANEAAALGLPAIVVDVDKSMESLLAEVSGAIGLSAPQGR